MTESRANSIVAAVPITLVIEKTGRATIVRLAGRLDAHAATEIGSSLASLAANRSVVLDVTGVPYLSSAGIRIMVQLHKKLAARGERLLVAGLQPYCHEVMKVSGLNQFFTMSETVEDALKDAGMEEEICENEAGKFTFHPGSTDAGSIEVLGHVEDVLAARITPSRVWSKKFSSNAYSLGLGALGESLEEAMPLMGEMMTIGGTMVWLPTDGNDTPDFLVPHQDSEEVVIRTGFNVSIAGKFNEYVEFESKSPAGANLGELYRALFDLAKRRRPDYRGALGLAMRAEIGQVFGSGVIKAPIASQAPPNGKWIIDPENYPSWFEVDDAPRHSDVSALICSMGLDLEANLDVFNRDGLGATSYINPGNTAPATGEKLHSHGVFFKPFPLGAKPLSLESEIASLVEEGEFVDMRHLFDKTTILWALIGIVYVQDFHLDPLANGEAGAG